MKVVIQMDYDLFHMEFDKKRIIIRHLINHHSISTNESSSICNLTIR